MNRVGAEERKGMRTTVDGVCLRVISNVRSLGLRDLHETVFLELSEREVLLVPLQTKRVVSDETIDLEGIATDCCCAEPDVGGAFLRMPFGFEFERDIGG